MITIIHGSDTASSRKFFLDIKKIPTQTIIDGKTITITDLIQIFEGGELFARSESFFIEQLVGKKKKSRDLTQIIEYINKNKNGPDIFIWEAQELSKAVLNVFKNAQIRIFKLPQTLFMFLESIRPGNGKTLIRLFQETIHDSEPEMVFFMMIRQIRMLLGLIEPTTDAIDEVKRMTPWQKSKLQQQADKFEITELKSLYSKLFEIEKAMKTGNLSMTLPETIDFLLLDI